MKKIAYVIIILIVLAAIVLGVALYQLNSIVAAIKPEIEKAATKAMAKPVTIGNIELSLFPKTKINLSNVTLGENEQKMVLESLSVDIDLYSMASKGISLDNPKGSLDNFSISASYKDIFRVNKASSPSVSFELGNNFLAKGDFQVDVTALTAAVTGSFQSQLTKDALTLHAMSLNLLGGTVSTPLQFNFSNFEFSTPLTIKNIDIEKAMSVMQGGAQSILFGDLTSVTGKINGIVGANLMNSLSGGLSVKVSNGGIRGVNIGGLALKEVKDLPLIQGSLFAYVPEGYRAILEDENTEFSEMTGDLSIRGGKISVQNIKLISKAYTVEANGTLGIDSSVDLNATINFSRDFSDGLVRASPGFQRVLSTEGTLVFPLTIKGVVPKVRIIPDLSKLIEIAGKKLIKDKAVGAIDKALGGNAGKILENLW